MSATDDASAPDDVATTPPRWVTTAWELRAEHAEPGAGAGTGPSSGTGLSAAKIVTAGIELADDDGLAALSIRKLAARLGAGTMATYRHVDSREHLVILMVDTALGAPPAHIIQTDAWHDRVRRWAIAISARYAAHPWLVDAPVAGFTATPHRALWLEYILQSLQPSGLNGRQMLDAALLIDGHARNVSALTRAVEADGEPHEGAADVAPAWLAALLPSAEYPMLSRVLSLDVFDEDSARDLEFGLGRIIDGIEALAVGEHAATVQRRSDTLTAP